MSGGALLNPAPWPAGGQPLAGDGTRPTLEGHAPVYLYDSHDDAERAIRALGQAGVDLKQLSLLGKGWHSEEHPVGFYTAGDRIRAWGGTGAFWGGIWGLLLAPAVFFLPGLGVTAMAGPLVTALVGALEGAVVVGGLSALGAALAQLGLPAGEVLRYETALKADKFVLVVHGTPAEQARALDVLRNLPSWHTGLA